MKQPHLITELESAPEEELGRVKNQQLSFSRLVFVAKEEDKVILGNNLLDSFAHSKGAAKINPGAKEEFKETEYFNKEIWKEE